MTQRMIGETIKLPHDEATFGVHAGQEVLVEEDYGDGKMLVACEEGHTLTVDSNSLYPLGDNEVVYAITVADVELVAGRKLTRDDFELVRKAIDNAEAGNAVWDAVTSALGPQ